MQALHTYRQAILAAFPEVSKQQLLESVSYGGDEFAAFVISHGMGPMWHVRTELKAFRKSRLDAEALYAVQEKALREIDAALQGGGVDYVVIKGAANRLLLFENPAIRACHDIDILVCPAQRVDAAEALVRIGFVADIDVNNISRELVLTRHVVNVDLHWGILREGRLRADLSGDMVTRRRRSREVSLLSSEDAVFLLLVHPAFAKHLHSWGMGVHRAVDILKYVDGQSFDWQAVLQRLRESGVTTAAWTTLRWVQLLAEPHVPDRLQRMLADTRPGGVRARWLEYWLSNDLPARLARWRYARLVGFSAFLHDSPADVLRALTGRQNAFRRRGDDAARFSSLDVE